MVQLKALRSAVVAIVAAHYPKITRLAKVHVAALNDIDRLQRLVVDLTMAHSAKEARTLIIALHDDSDDEEE